MTHQRYLRSEAWGNLVYLPARDEFEAHTDSGSGRLEIYRVSRPISVGLVITGRCNLACAFCYGNEEALPTEELNLDEWTEVLRVWRAAGVMRIDVSGGEPAIRPDLGALVERAVDMGFGVVISTNGLLWTPERLAALTPAVRLHVSIDSGFATVHDRSRQKRNLRSFDGALEETLTFIASCVTSGRPVRVLTAVGAHNQSAMGHLAEQLALIGVRDWSVSRILHAGRAQAEPARWRSGPAVAEQVQEFRSMYEWMRIAYSDRTSDQGYFLLLLPNGEIATQAIDGRDKVRLGSWRDVASLSASEDFDIALHARKWIARTIDCRMNCLDCLGVPLAA